MIRFAWEVIMAKHELENETREKKAKIKITISNKKSKYTNKSICLLSTKKI